MEGKVVFGDREGDAAPEVSRGCGDCSSIFYHKKVTETDRILSFGVEFILRHQAIFWWL